MTTGMILLTQMSPLKKMKMTILLLSGRPKTKVLPQKSMSSSKRLTLERPRLIDSSKRSCEEVTKLNKLLLRRSLKRLFKQPMMTCTWKMRQILPRIRCTKSCLTLFARLIRSMIMRVRVRIHLFHRVKCTRQKCQSSWRNPPRISTHLTKRKRNRSWTVMILSMLS